MSTELLYLTDNYPTHSHYLASKKSNFTSMTQNNDKEQGQSSDDGDNREDNKKKEQKTNLQPTLQEEEERQTKCCLIENEKYTATDENVPELLPLNESVVKKLKNLIGVGTSSSTNATIKTTCRNLKSGSIRLLLFGLQILGLFLDLIITCISSNVVHNVIRIIFAMCVEVFVLVVLTISTIIASIIIKIDESQRRQYHMKCKLKEIPENDSAEEDAEEYEFHQEIPNPRPLRVRGDGKDRQIDPNKSHATQALLETNPNLNTSEYKATNFISSPQNERQAQNKTHSEGLKVFETPIKIQDNEIKRNLNNTDEIKLKEVDSKKGVISEESKESQFQTLLTVNEGMQSESSTAASIVSSDLEDIRSESGRERSENTNNNSTSVSLTAEKGNSSDVPENEAVHRELKKK